MNSVTCSRLPGAKSFRQKGVPVRNLLLAILLLHTHVFVEFESQQDQQNKTTSSEQAGKLSDCTSALLLRPKAQADAPPTSSQLSHPTQHARQAPPRRRRRRGQPARREDG